MNLFSINFLNWWNKDSNGHDYMTLLQCAMDDTLVVSFVFLGCLGVVLQYADITIKNYKQYKDYPDSKIAKNSIHLVGVFAICLVTGYLFRMLSVWINPYKLLVLLLVILNVVTYLFRKSSKDLNIYYEIHQLETKFKDQKDKIKSISESITINLFDSDNDMQHIPYDVLDAIDYNSPFYSDETETLLNTRDRDQEPHFYAYSKGDPNGRFLKKLTHDTKKYLTCVEGSFFEENTNKWYNVGDTLIVEPFDWHLIVYGKEGVTLRTLILQP
jgi:hypothetical protein